MIHYVRYMPTPPTPESRRPLIRDIQPPSSEVEDPFASIEAEAPGESEPMAPEQSVEAPQAEAPAPTPAPTVVHAAPTPVPSTKDRLEQEIEAVMEADLTDLFLSMTPEQQQKFSKAGEETAHKIRTLARNARKHARKIFDLITDWLRLIPGVNKFFLEQEAKIKTDRIILLAESSDLTSL